MPGELWSWEKDPRHRTSDILYLDMPRGDVVSFKSKAGRKVYVGSSIRARREALKAAAKNVLDSNFTVDEVRSMGGLYFEASCPTRRAAATCEHVRLGGGRDANIISVKRDYLDNEWVLTHELVHARRFGTGESLTCFDRNAEEKRTELETVARVKDFENIHVGYYQYLARKPGGWTVIIKGGKRRMTHPKVEEAIKKDRIGLTGSLNKSLKGKEAVERVKEYYPKSEIFKVHFSEPEKLDRYFLVKVGGMEINLHVRYDEPVTLDQIREDMRRAYGPDAEVWEYIEGKKKRIL